MTELDSSAAGEARSVTRPEDVVQFIAATLQESGRPVRAGYEVDLAPLFQRITPGPDYVRLNEHIDAAQRSYRWIEPAGIGHTYQLTPGGAAKAEQLERCERAIGTALGVARVRLQNRQRDFERSRRSIEADYSRRGMLQSGIYVVAVRQAVIEELSLRARLVAQAFAELVPALSEQLGPDRFREAQGQAREVLESGVADVLAAVRTSEQQGGMRLRTAADLDSLMREALAELAAELAAADVRPADRTPGPTSPVTANNRFEFHAPVGAVQSGDHAHAEVSMTIDPGALEMVKQTLSELLQQIGEERRLGAEERAALVGSLETALAEANKPQPNKVTLRGLVAGLGLTIQTMADMPSVWLLLLRGADAVLR